MEGLQFSTIDEAKRGWMEKEFDGEDILDQGYFSILFGGDRCYGILS